MIKVLKNKINFLKRNKSFTLLWSSQILSRFGDSLETIAFMFLVLKLTGSAIAMGTVMVINLTPNLLLTPLAGVLVDRYSRKKMMILAEFLRAIIILSIPIALYFNILTIIHLYVVAFLVSIFETFFETANTAAVPNLFDNNEDRTVGYSLRDGTRNLVQLIGLSVSGLFVVYFGYFAIFIFDALTFFISGLAIVKMKIPQTFKETTLKGIKGFTADFTQGLSYLRTKKIFMIILYVAAIVNLILTPLQVVILYATENVFHVNKSIVGIALSMLLLGAFIGNILYPAVSKRFSKKMIMVGGFGLIGVGLGLGGIIINFYSFMFGIFILSFATGICSICISLLFAETVDDEFRGRAASVLNFFILIGGPLGSALIGILLDTIGVITFLQIGGAIIVVSSLLMYKSWPSIQKQARPETSVT